MDRIERVYDYRRRLRNAMKNLEKSDVSEENKNKILEFCDQSTAKGIKSSRTIRYITTLCQLSEILQKPFEDATKEDLQRVLRKVEERDYSGWTKRSFRAVVRVFYKWLRDTEELPEEVKWVKLGKVQNNLSPGDLLTKEEVERMVGAAYSLRDKAMIAVLYDSACRPHELLTLRIKDIRFDLYGAQLTVDGKTGQRTVRIIAAAPILATWLNTHQTKNRPDAPVFPSFGYKNRHDFMTYNSFKKVIQDTAKAAGIKRRVYPYLFRHSKLTELVRSGFAGYQLNLFAGWSMDSRMPRTYVHLHAGDVDDQLLKLNGMSPPETGEPGFKPEACPRCRQQNTPGTDLCNSCGLPANLRSAQKLEKSEEKVNRLVSELAKSPEAVDVLLGAIETFNNGKKTPA